MASRTIALTKFVGTVSLGLLTGLSYTTHAHTTPTLLTLPSATQAKHILSQLAPETELSTLALSTLTSISLLTTYILSPPRGRHPYIIYAALFSILPYTREAYLSVFGGANKKDCAAGFGGKEGKRFGTATAGKATPHTPTSSEGSDEEWEVEASGMRTSKSSAASTGKGEEVNGEAVRESVRVWRRGILAQGVSYGLGFAIMVVGIWGDGA